MNGRKVLEQRGTRGGDGKDTAEGGHGGGTGDGGRGVLVVENLNFRVSLPTHELVCLFRLLRYVTLRFARGEGLRIDRCFGANILEKVILILGVAGWLTSCFDLPCRYVFTARVNGTGSVCFRSFMCGKKLL